MTDLLKWDQALYTDTLLPAAAREVMWTPFKDGYAYGWSIAPPSPATFGQRRIAHSGGINGFSSMLIRVPDANVTAIVLANNMAVNAGAVDAGAGEEHRVVGLVEAPLHLAVFVDPGTRLGDGLDVAVDPRQHAVDDRGSGDPDRRMRRNGGCLGARLRLSQQEGRKADPESNAKQLDATGPQDG